MADDAVAKLIREMAQHCLPALERKCAAALGEVRDVASRKISGVWSGSGCIVEVKVSGSSGESATFVAKKIGSYKDCRRESNIIDHISYYNELSFYETDIPDRMCEAGAACPRPLYVDRHPSGAPDKSHRAVGAQTAAKLEAALRRHHVKVEGREEEHDEGLICMTKLPGGRWGESKDQVRAALSWLARLHALFWGPERADAAVAQGVADQACFWHLDTRHLELANMGLRSPLRLAAVGLDARLKADAMQTMCHGDPKGANIMFDKAAGVSMYDFQWFGKAPPVKDLAYFFATAVFLCRDWSEAEERALLQYYHTELGRLLLAQGDTEPTFDYLYTSYMLAVCDYHRWIEGGFCWGDINMISHHTDVCFKKLHEKGGPKSEEEYQERIFECFPP